MKKHITTLLQGIALGIAEIIPGVSGSTVALLMGIYDDFINLLYEGTELLKVIVLFVIRKKTWNDVITQIAVIPWGFGIMLGIGMVSAVIGLSNVIIRLLVDYPAHLFAFLFGLTFPTMILVWQQIKKKSGTVFVVAGVTAVALLAIFMISGAALKTTNPHPVHLFVGGMVGVSTMVLPGVSGSFMLLVLGLYNFAVGLISDLSQGNVSNEALTQLFILLAGMATGFLTTVRLLKVAFEKARDQVMSFILGLLVASWYVLWPFIQVSGLDDHGEPILEKILPTAVPLALSMQLVLIAGATAVIVYLLQVWADTHDETPNKRDAGMTEL